MMANQMNNQNNFLTRTRQLIRRCSCCRSEQHNISQCNDPRLINFQANLISRRDELREIPSIDVDNKIAYFETWLYGQDHHLVKSYAMRFCGAYSRNNLQLCVSKIVSLIWNVEQDFWGNQMPIENNYIPLPTVNVSQESLDLLDLRLVEFLAGLRNDREQTSENRKFNISGILCVEIESEERTTKQILEELDTIENCNICYEDKQNRHIVSLNCKHKFCGECVSQTLKKCNQLNLPNCALCRAKIEFLIIKDQEIFNTLKQNIV
jgi:nitrate reductase NapAB chaperone NapD